MKKISRTFFESHLEVSVFFKEKREVRNDTMSFNGDLRTLTEEKLIKFVEKQYPNVRVLDAKVLSVDAVTMELEEEIFMEHATVVSREENTQKSPTRKKVEA